MAPYEHHTTNRLLGCVKRVIINETDQKVSLYNTAQLDFLHGLMAAALKDAPGPWVTVCEQHYQIASHATEHEAEGRLLMPSTWCKSCALAAQTTWKTQ